MFRAALTYHPNIGTFRGKRGAWRVHRCWRPSAVEHKHIGVGPWQDATDAPQIKVLLINVTKQLHRHTFVNPTALLRRGLLAAH